MCSCCDWLCNILVLALLHCQTNEYILLQSVGIMTLISVLEEEGWKMRVKRMNQEQVVVSVSHGQFVGAHGCCFMMVTLDAVEDFTGQAV